VDLLHKWRQALAIDTRRVLCCVWYQPPELVDCLCTVEVIFAKSAAVDGERVVSVLQQAGGQHVGIS
jgi:hypothetical protein